LNHFTRNGSVNSKKVKGEWNMNGILCMSQSSAPFREILSKDDELWIPVLVEHPLEALFYLENYPEKWEMVLLVEQDIKTEGLTGTMASIRKMLQMEWVPKVVTITRNRVLFDALASDNNEKHACYFVEDAKISPHMVLQVLKELKIEPAEEKKGLGSFLKKSIFKPTQDPWNVLSSQRKEELYKALQKTSRILGFTGYHASGATSTASNIAYLASIMGLKTYLLDLDTQGRGMNIYYSKFGEEADANRQIEGSLLECIRQPDEFEKNACRINENLFLSTLSYSYELSEKEKANILGTKNLGLMFHILKEKANLVIIDVPMDQLRALDSLSNYVDAFGICVNNNLYSLIHSAQSLKENLGADALFWRKASMIVSKFNQSNTYKGKPFSMQMCMDLFSHMMGDGAMHFKTLGHIPYFKEFDLLLDMKKKAVMYKRNISECYFEILENII
jgi:Mrp family chromosome partitioning ATPase